jgi:SpoIIAA-like
MLVYSSKYVEIQFFESQSLLEAVWLPTTENMNQEEYKATFEKILTLFQEYHPVFWLGDTVNFKMAVVPELQEWTAQTLTPQLIDLGLRKMALLIPEELIANLALQQSVDEITDEMEQEKAFEMRYFDKIEEARKWLKA